MPHIHLPVEYAVGRVGVWQGAILPLATQRGATEHTVGPMAVWQICENEVGLRKVWLICESLHRRR